MARLVLLREDAEQEFKLQNKVSYLGRKSTCDVVTDNSSASRHHARIINDMGDYLVVDTQSRNGTLVNGQKISKKFLSDQDHIKIGTQEFKFLLDPEDKTPDFQLTKYEIIEKIGRGGMGKVYKAKQKSMDRIVALKILNDKFSSNSEFVERFIREAQAAGKLSHPNIIHVHDVSKENDLYYFSMEYVAGQSVMSLILDKERIPIKEAQDIIKQICKALEFAHSHNLIHRDIKPDNIMITEEGEAKLADLGIASDLREANDEQEKKTIYGTPLYMAPEQALGQPVDHRLDIYSLGATYYHMVVGQPPFTGNTAIELLKKHINEPLVPPINVKDDIPEEVSRQIEIMMAKNPEDRYQNAREIIEEIEKLQAGSSISSRRLAMSETSILQRLSTGKELEPSVNVIDYPSDEQVNKLISLDPKKRNTLIFAALFLVGLISTLIFIVFFTGMLKDRQDTADPETEAVIQEKLDSLPELRDQAKFKQEYDALREIASLLPETDPRYTEARSRMTFLQEFFRKPDSQDLVREYRKAYRNLEETIEAEPGNHETIMTRAQECMHDEFKALFPDHYIKAFAAYSRAQKAMEGQVQSEEAELYRKIMAEENTALESHYAVRRMARDYIRKFEMAQLDADHMTDVKTRLAAAEKGIRQQADNVREQREQEIKMLRISLESAIENSEFSKIYSLCTEHKNRKPYKDSEWGKKVDELFTEFEGKLKKIFTESERSVQNEFNQQRYSVVLSEIEAMNAKFSGTPLLAKAKTLTAKYRKLIDKAYTELLKTAREDTAEFQYTKARFRIMKESNSFIGTDYHKRLDTLSNEYESLNSLFTFILDKGASVSFKLTVSIEDTGYPNTLIAVKQKGIFVQLKNPELAPARFIKWEELPDSQKYQVFKTVLINTETGDEEIKALQIYCRHHNLLKELDDARTLETADK